VLFLVDFALIVVLFHFNDIVARFAERRDDCDDAFGASIVGGEREKQIIVVALQQVAKKKRTTLDIFPGSKNNFHAALRGGLGHELHQAASIAARNRFGIKVGFDRDNAGDEVSVDLVFRGGGLDEFVIRAADAGLGLGRVGGEEQLRLDGDDF